MISAALWLISSAYCMNNQTYGSFQTSRPAYEIHHSRGQYVQQLQKAHKKEWCRCTQCNEVIALQLDVTSYVFQETPALETNNYSYESCLLCLQASGCRKRYFNSYTLHESCYKKTHQRINTILCDACVFLNQQKPPSENRFSCLFGCF